MNRHDLGPFLLQKMEERLTQVNLSRGRGEIQQSLQLMQLLIQLKTPLLFPGVTLGNINIQTSSLILRLGRDTIPKEEYERLITLTVKACREQGLNPQALLIGLIPKDVC